MKVPVGATLTTVCGVAILLSLGTWQMQRLHWKNAIIERLDKEYAGATNADDAQATTRLSDWALEEEPIGYIKISGTLHRDDAILLGPRIENGRSGYNLIVPLEPEGGRVLLVNTGWVNELWKDTLSDRLPSLPIDKITVQGVIHKPDWTFMTSKNSPANDLWFRGDITEIAAAKNIKDPYPFMLYADDITPPLLDVKPHEERWLPRNKHLQYALFWYAMAAAMAGVYGFYLKSRNKEE